MRGVVCRAPSSTRLGGTVVAKMEAIVCAVPERVIEFIVLPVWRPMGTWWAISVVTMAIEESGNVWDKTWDAVAE